MNWFNNLRFVRKIQGGFLAIAGISTLVVFLGYIQLNKISDFKNEIFESYVIPQGQIESAYSEFQKIQFIMMQFSMEEFRSKFSENVQQYDRLKASMDQLIDTLLSYNSKDELINELSDIKNIWIEYKTIVADAILSASVTGNYEMASDIAVTSGEEVGKSLHSKFDAIHKILVEKSDKLNYSAENTVNTSFYFTLGGALLGTVIFFFCILYIAPAITKPIEYLKSIVKEFTLGNYETEIKINTKDEIGELAELFVELQKAQVEKIHSAEMIASGVIEKIKEKSDKDTLAKAFNKEAEIINNILAEANKLIKANEEGNFDIRANADNFSGSWKQLIIGINSIQEALLAPINESSEILSHLAKGDLTARVNGDYKGDHQLIKNSINTVAESLSKALIEVKEAVMATVTTSGQISSNTVEMSAGAQKQSAQTSEVAAAVEEMTRTILETSRNTETVSVAAKEAKDTSTKGKIKIDNTKDSIKKVVESSKRVGEIITSLAKKSEQIGEITQVIDDIADQTNLLALNAAIEAARAGEQGRGFAVVADEVRKLAERTTKATKEIAETIKAVQDEAHTADVAMDDAKNMIGIGMKNTEEVEKILNEINSESTKVADLIYQISATSEEQSTTAEQISKNIESINNVTHESADGIKQVAAAAENLNKLTDNLQNLISRFKIVRQHSDEEESFSLRNYAESM